MTLNDLERRNSSYFAFFSPNSIVLQADVTVVEGRFILSVKLSPSSITVVQPVVDKKNWMRVRRASGVSDFGLP